VAVCIAARLKALDQVGRQRHRRGLSKGYQTRDAEGAVYHAPWRCRGIESDEQVPGEQFTPKRSEPTSAYLGHRLHWAKQRKILTRKIAPRPLQPFGFELHKKPTQRAPILRFVEINMGQSKNLTICSILNVSQKIKMKRKLFCLYNLRIFFDNNEILNGRNPEA